MLFESLDVQAREVAGLKVDHRWSKWSKWIDSVDPKGKGAYMYQGTFINSGTIELEIGKPRLILCCTETGSAKYRSKNYAIVVFNADGTLTPTELTAKDDKPGWELRLRDPVIALLNVLQKPQEVGLEEPAETLFALYVTEDTANRLAYLKEQVNQTSDNFVIQLVVDFYLSQFKL